MNKGHGVSQFNFMSQVAVDEKLQKLLRNNPNVWRGGDTPASGSACSVATIPTGFSQLDAVLPGGGWPANALVEIIASHWGIGELQLLAPVMASLNQAQGWLVWVAPPYIPYPTALQNMGVDTRRVIILHPDQGNNDVIWSMEKTLRSAQCAMTMAWPQHLTHTAIRRLQLAAQSGQSFGVLFRTVVAKTSPATLRLQLTATSDTLKVHLLKIRGACRTDSISIHLASL